MNQKTVIVYNLKIYKDLDKSIGIKQESSFRIYPEGKTLLFLPLSQIEMVDGNGTYSMPEWLARKNNLEYEDITLKGQYGIFD